MKRQTTWKNPVQGNDLFQCEDFSSAVRCYSIALGHMTRIVNHNKATYKLLGILLSNRAISFLSLETQRSSVEFWKALVSYAEKDCNTALESSWAVSSLPKSILDKLHFRRDKASARHHTLNCQYEHLSDFMFSNSQSDEEN